MNTQEKRELIAKRFKEANYLDFKEIHVEMGKFQNVGKCADNAFQILHSGDADTVAGVVYITPEGLMRYHYVTKVADDKYKDDTLGYLAKLNTYYLDRELTFEDIKDERAHLLIRDAIRGFIEKLFTPEEIKTFSLDKDFFEFM